MGVLSTMIIFDMNDALLERGHGIGRAQTALLKQKNAIDIARLDRGGVDVRIWYREKT